MSEREEYTPDTGAVRAAYTRAMRQAFIASTSEHIEEFNRWLAAHDRTLREQIAQKIEVEMRRHDNTQIGFSAVGDAYAHASRIARGEVGA